DGRRGGQGAGRGWGGSGAADRALRPADRRARRRPDRAAGGDEVGQEGDRPDAALGAARRRRPAGGAARRARRGRRDSVAKVGWLMADVNQLKTLSACRGLIDTLDMQILALLNERAKVVEQVGRLK